jgi:histidinol-phosphate aminotransferase
MTDSFPAKRVRDLPLLVPPAIPDVGPGPDPSVVRMNLNESPLQPSPKALAAAAEAIQFSNRYPDHGCTGLMAKLAALNNFPAENIIFGNGSSELLGTLAMASLNEGDEAIFPEPTFPTGLKTSRIAGATLVKIPVAETGENDIAAMLAAVTEKTGLFYVCTPNNPTGNLASEEALRRASQEVPERCLLMIDEAYYEFGAHEGGPDVLEILKDRKGPWAVTRSLSKAYCLAGMRVGYALVSGKEVRDPLNTLRGNFNISRVAMAAAEAAVDDQAHMRKVLDQTILERNRLTKLLAVKGFSALPSFANFIVVRSSGPLAPVQKKLAQHGILTQYMPWPDENGSLRITVGSSEETDKLCSVIG